MSRPKPDQSDAQREADDAWQIALLFMSPFIIAATLCEFTERVDGVEGLQWILGTILLVLVGRSIWLRKISQDDL